MNDPFLDSAPMRYVLLENCRKCREIETAQPAAAIPRGREWVPLLVVGFLFSLQFIPGV